MGMFRKMTSFSTLGLVDFRSDKERTARYTKKTMKATQRGAAIQGFAVAGNSFDSAVERYADRRRQDALAKLPPPPMSPLPPPPDLPDPPGLPATLVADLETVARLREAGHISDDEYERVKIRLLHGL